MSERVRNGVLVGVLATVGALFLATSYEYFVGRLGESEGRFLPQDTLVLSDASYPSRDNEDQIWSRLRQPISIDYRQRPLLRVLDDLRGKLDVQFDVKHVGLFDAKIDPQKVLITQELDNVRGFAVLDRILEPWNLGWVVNDECVQITSIDLANEALVNRVYDVSDVLAWFRRLRHPLERDRFGGTSARLRSSIFGGQTYAMTRFSDGFADAHPDEQLKTLIYELTHAWWDDMEGSGGTATVREGLLSVYQTKRAQLEVDDILTRLREVRDHSRPGDFWVVPSTGYGDPSNAVVYEKLRAKIDVDLRNVPFYEALAKLAVQSGIRIDRHVESLTPTYITSADRVTLSCSQRSVQAVLDRMLRDDYGLTTVVRDGGLIVMTSDYANEIGIPVIYDVRDLFAAGLSREHLRHLMSNHAPLMWDHMDGAGGCTATLGGFQIVRQSQAGHQEIGRLLEDVRRKISVAGRASSRPVSDEPCIVQFYRIPDEVDVDPQELRRILTRFVFPDTWARHGRRINVINRKLIIRQTVEAHEAVRAFLDELSNVNDARPQPPPEESTTSLEP